MALGARSSAARISFGIWASTRGDVVAEVRIEMSPEVAQGLAAALAAVGIIAKPTPAGHGGRPCSRCGKPSADEQHRRCARCRGYDRDRMRTRRANAANNRCEHAADIAPANTLSTSAGAGCEQSEQRPHSSAPSVLVPAPSSSSSSCADGCVSYAANDDGDDGCTQVDAADNGANRAVPSAWSRMRAAAARRSTEVSR